jgi:hypothetical protein
MRPSTILSSLLCLVFPFIALAELHGIPNHHRHRDLANRSRGDVQLFKRFDNARFTYYAVGLGACGKWNKPGDFIVALNVHQYGGGYPGPNCFKMITISFGGKTAQAQIMDECMGCPYGGLDFSEGLFQYFSDLGAGVLYGSWEFNGGGGGGGGGAPPPQPTTTHTTHHTTTTTHNDPPTTTTTTKQEDTTTTTSHSSTSSTSSSTSKEATTTVDVNDGPASGLASPTGTTSPNDVINKVNQVVIALGAIGEAGNRLH